MEEGAPSPESPITRHFCAGALKSGKQLPTVCLNRRLAHAALPGVNPEIPSPRPSLLPFSFRRPRRKPRNPVSREDQVRARQARLHHGLLKSSKKFAAIFKGKLRTLKVGRSSGTEPVLGMPRKLTSQVNGIIPGSRQLRRVWGNFLLFANVSTIEAVFPVQAANSHCRAW